MLAIVLLVAGMAQNVWCTSSSENIGLCDALSPMFGCRSDGFEVVDGVENRLSCADKATQQMHWATKAVHTDIYRLWIGDEQNPTTSYTPGKLHDVSIRVTQHRMNYRGILMYAKAGNNKVGSWELPVEDPQRFQIASSCPNSVMHTSASEKPYLVTFQWRAPAAGSGPVTFECLLKSGPANHGAFYWPNKDGNVVLQEGSAKTETHRWVRSELGESCTEACVAQSGSTMLECDAAEIRKIDSPEKLKAAVGDEHVCKLPYLRTCNAVGPSSSVDNLCYYHLDYECPSSMQATNCNAKSDKEHEGRRFCACKDTGRPNSGFVPTTKPATTAVPVDGTTKPVVAGGTTAAGDTTVAVNLPPVNPVYPTNADGKTPEGQNLYPVPMGCQVGSRLCPCKSGACRDSQDRCVGQVTCFDDSPSTCQELAGVCVSACEGQENCECNPEGNCYDDLVCFVIGNSGICSKDTSTVEDPLSSGTALATSIGVAAAVATQHLL